MRLHRIVLLAVLVAMSSPAVSDAATKPKPKPICNLILDDGKDDGDSDLIPLAESPMVDILSADIATSKNEIVAIMRVKSVSADGDMWTQLTYDWNFGSNANGTSYGFSAHRTGSGDFTSGAKVGSNNYAHTFTVDPVQKALIWRIKRSLVKEAARPKLVWTKFAANTKMFSSTADQAANSDGKYPDLAPSCLKAK